MSRIESNLQAVRQRIEQACRTSARPVAGVQLLAVSKTFGAEAVLQAIAAGQRAFGENYVQEGVDKRHAVVQALGPAARSSLQWHLIGPIQSNKTRPIAEHFDWVHTIDRLKVAERLSAQRPAHLPALQVCVQVNVSGEASKSGVAPADALPLAQAVARLPRLALRGVMAIPAPSSSPVEQRAAFAAVRAVFDQLVAAGLALDTLSMGMSADLEAAIAEGATLVRVGSAIFGERAPRSA